MLEDSFSSDPMLAGLAVQVHICRLLVNVSCETIVCVLGTLLHVRYKLCNAVHVLELGQRILSGELFVMQPFRELHHILPVHLSCTGS